METGKTDKLQDRKKLSQKWDVSLFTVATALCLLLSAHCLYADVRSFQDGVSPDAGYDGTTDVELDSTVPSTPKGDANDFTIAGTVDDARNAIIKWDISSITPGSTIITSSMTLITTTN